MSESNLQDRAAIHDLFTRYCCALDYRALEDRVYRKAIDHGLDLAIVVTAMLLTI